MFHILAIVNHHTIRMISCIGTAGDPATHWAKTIIRQKLVESGLEAMRQ